METKTLEIIKICIKISAEEILPVRILPLITEATEGLNGEVYLKLNTVGIDIPSLVNLTQRYEVQYYRIFCSVKEESFANTSHMVCDSLELTTTETACFLIKNKPIPVSLADLCKYINYYFSLRELTQILNIYND